MTCFDHTPAPCGGSVDPRAPGRGMVAVRQRRFLFIFVHTRSVTSSGNMSIAGKLVSKKRNQTLHLFPLPVDDAVHPSDGRYLFRLSDQRSNSRIGKANLSRFEGGKKFSYGLQQIADICAASHCLVWVTRKICLSRAYPAILQPGDRKEELAIDPGKKHWVPLVLARTSDTEQGFSFSQVQVAKLKVQCFQ